MEDTLEKREHHTQPLYCMHGGTEALGPIISDSQEIRMSFLETEAIKGKRKVCSDCELLFYSDSASPYPAKEQEHKDQDTARGEVELARMEDRPESFHI